MTGFQILIAVGGLIGLYLLVCNRVIYAVHPLRMELSDIGVRLLESGRLDDKWQSYIEASLDHAYSPLKAWMYVILYPFLMVVAAFDIVAKRPDPTDSVPDDLKEDVWKFIRLSLVSELAASPFAGLLFILEAAVFLLLFLPVGRAVREAKVLFDHTRNFHLLDGRQA